MSIQKPNEPGKAIGPSKPPDTARSYERADPNKEAGMGRLDNDAATPADQPDRAEDAVSNQQVPKGITADETIDRNGTARDLASLDSEGRPLPAQPDHSMKDEEPLGWDEAPNDIHDPRLQRHPRAPGNDKGGTP